MSRPLATIGIDIDPIDLHLAGQGHRSLPPDPLVYDFAVPRLLELCERCGIATTLFVVARDATAHSDVLTAAVDAGHEIASHSLTHPIGLARMPIEALRRECSESRWLLEQTSGAPVVGFRSPQFDMSSRALEVLAEAGYAYDASACPTPMLISTRLSMMVKNPDASGATRLKILPFTWRRAPHLRRLGTRTMHEFPLSVTPLDRFPLHHALRYRMSDGRFDRLLGGFVWRKESLSYLVHAADLLGMAEDKVDPRMSGYSGMKRPLAFKLALLERTFCAIATRFETRPFRDRLIAA